MPLSSIKPYSLLEILETRSEMGQEEEGEVEAPVLGRLLKIILVNQDADVDAEAQQVGESYESEARPLLPCELLRCWAPSCRHARNTCY